MFKIIKIEYFDQFQCITSNCPANCCDNQWEITIDEDTYALYRELGIPDLSQKITDTLPHRIIKTDTCPFITQDGLCSLHLHYGEKALSNTCRSYPRFVSSYGDLYVENLGISCPEVARMLLDTNRLLKVTETLYHEKASEKNRRMAKLASENLMRRLIAPYCSVQTTLEDAFAQCYNQLSVTNYICNDLQKLVTLIREAFVESLDDAQKAILFPSPEENPEMPSLSSAKALIDAEYPFLLKNICISYLFEHIMLESKSIRAQYENVIFECEMLVNVFTYVLSSNNIYDCIHSKEKMIHYLYNTMRLLDHSEFFLKELRDGYQKLLL